MKHKIKTIDLIEALATSKSILKLMGTKKNLEIPANDIGNLLSILQKIKNQDNTDNDQQTNDLITQLQSINAYIIGASQDVNSIASQLRKMPDIKSKLDSQLTSESTLHNLIQIKILKEYIRRAINESASGGLSVDIKALESNLENRHKVSLSISYSEYSNTIIFSRIVVNKENRSEGIGTAVMKELCAFADQQHIRIALTPSSDFGGSKGRLTKFYRAFGFKPYKGFEFNETMVREPTTIPSLT